MMKTILLLGPAIVAGAIRYPAEGPRSVRDDEADRLIDAGLAEDATEELESPEGDDLEAETVAELKKLAEAESIDLGAATTKAAIIAAIRAERAKKEG